MEGFTHLIPYAAGHEIIRQGRRDVTMLELPVQVNGKLRDKISVPADADEMAILTAAENAEKVRPWVEGKTIHKKLYVPKKLVNFVVG